MNRSERDVFDKQVLDAVHNGARTLWDVRVRMGLVDMNHEDMSKQIRLSVVRLRFAGRIEEDSRGLHAGRPA